MDIFWIECQNQFINIMLIMVMITLLLYISLVMMLINNYLLCEVHVMNII